VSCIIFELFDVEENHEGQGTLKVINTIQQIAYEFLLAFHCNYGHIKNSAPVSATQSPAVPD